MALDYTTEVEHLFPQVLYQDALVAPVLQRLKIPLEAAGNKVTLFIDPRTVAALNAASESLKTLMRDHRIGLICYGGNLSRGKTEFLMQNIHKFIQEYGSHTDALRCAVLDLHQFVWKGAMGQLDTNPFAGTVHPAPAEPFDMAQALATMARQMEKPKSPDFPDGQPVSTAVRPGLIKRLLGRA